jgi:3-hydroxyisobutyrate dehydrogenase-like beta-hydroxyacid dehydrogenase
MVFAFIGFGEVSYSISTGFLQDFGGVTPVYAYDTLLGSGKPIEKSIRDRAAEVGVVLVNTLEDAVKDADIVFCAVQGAYSLEVGKTARDFLKSGAVYIDLTTAYPSHKLALEQFYVEKGLDFVDAAMLGPLPLYLHKVPMLISGTGAVKAEPVMRKWNMAVTLVAGAAGEASKIKLTRSIFMKGLQALLVETFLFARKAGVEDIVLDSIDESMRRSSFKDTVTRLVSADLIHAERRAHEVSDSALVMEELGITPIMAKAIVRRLKASAALGCREELGGKPPSCLAEVYALWEKKHYA